MNTSPPWRYDEFKHLATDFHDPKQVESYDARQQTNLQNEERLVQELGIDGSHTLVAYLRALPVPKS